MPKQLISAEGKDCLMKGSEKNQNPAQHFNEKDWLLKRTFYLNIVRIDLFMINL